MKSKEVGTAEKKAFNFKSAPLKLIQVQSVSSQQMRTVARYSQILYS